VDLQVSFGSRTFEASGLFFDKDGTLVDFHHQYATLMEKRCELMLSHCEGDGEILRKAIGLAVGYDPETREISPFGPLAIGTRSETISAVAEVLTQYGMPREKAHDMVFRAFLQADQELKIEQLVRPVDGLVSVLSSLRESGLILACLTNDDRRRAQAVLNCLGVSSYFDLVLSADEVTHPKPDPEMFQKACHRLDLHPWHIAFIGDTVADMAMAKKGGAGLAVGVLGGASDRSLLSQEAEVVIDSLEAISVAT
jgi:phosphoglycolate phosphatase